MARAPGPAAGVLPVAASTPDPAQTHAGVPVIALLVPPSPPESAFAAGPFARAFAAFRGWCHRHHWTRRDLRFVCYALAIVLMSLADLKMTLAYATTVGMTEVNPIARFLMVYGGVCSIVLWKSATVVCGVFILWRIRRHRAAEVGAWICCGILAALCVHWFRYNEQVTTLAAEVMHLHESKNGDWVVVGSGRDE